MIRPVLLIGAVSVDRFPDGRRAAGGAVLHAARALAHAGRPVAWLALAGRDSVAAGAVAELEALGSGTLAGVRASPHFAIDEGRRPRQVILERAFSASLPVGSGEIERMVPGAVLLAPVAGEIDPAGVELGAVAGGRATVLGGSMQGWLRELRPGRPVRARRLARLPSSLVALLGGLHLLVASQEDLAAEADDPAAQLRALRGVVGDGPLLVITAGLDGLWLSAAGVATAHLSVVEPILDVSTVGAGDALAGLMTAELAGGATPLAAARGAMGGVSSWLAARSSTGSG